MTVNKVPQRLSEITISGARQHNLRNIGVRIPRNTLTVITGLSGSGKSSLAFDTIYAEGQRRYVETLSAYARQFLDQMERPDVDSIEGLSPPFRSIRKPPPQPPQHRRHHHGNLRLPPPALLIHRHSALSRLRQRNIRADTEQILRHVLSLRPDERIQVMAPIVRGRKGEFKKEMEKLARQGFVRARVDGTLRSLDEEIALDKRRNHTIEVIVDRLVVKPGIEKRLEASIETATKLANGLVLISVVDGEERLYSRNWPAGVRHQRTGTGAALVLVQQPIRRVRRVLTASAAPGRSTRKSDSRPLQAAARRRPGTRGAASTDNRQVEARRKALRVKVKTTPWEKLSDKRAHAWMQEGRRRTFLESSRILTEIYAESADYREELTVTCRLCPARPAAASVCALQPGRARAQSFDRRFTAMPIARASHRALLGIRDRELQIAGRIVDEIRRRLEFLESSASII